MTFTEALGELIEEFITNEVPLTPESLDDAMWVRFPDLMQKQSGQLVRDQVWKGARDYARREEDEEQLALPGLAPGIPRMLVLYADGGSRIIAAAAACYEEITLAKRIRHTNVRAVSARSDRFDAALAPFLPLMETDRSLTLAEAVAALRPKASA